ncbi:hypothetical protein [Caenispirillum bisanense]|uniref:Uncharacterized protein n=1 Tax=Caenispirillum bisanense TaxID=414052 RepID=A0A286H334_9PROT|nr:hypothetical protein [Caenispirillum bisanense]SOE01694.1 hypothetical protein SAMN05421508_1229 [Caenispirillum bisanense]
MDDDYLEGRPRRAVNAALEALLGNSYVTAPQFIQHMDGVVAEEARVLYGRFVGEVDPRELVDLARMASATRARYVGTALAMTQAKSPPGKPEIEELRELRERADELDRALDTIKRAAAEGLITLKGLAADR